MPKAAAREEQESPYFVPLAAAGAATPMALNRAALAATERSTASPMLGGGPDQPRLAEVAKKMGFRSGELAYRPSSESYLETKFRPGGKMSFTVGLAPNASEAVMAHELGHAQNAKMMGRLRAPFSALKSLANMGLYSGPRILGRSIPLLPAAASAYAATDGDPSWTPAIGTAALGAPALLEEGMASGRAAGHLIRQHGLGGGLRRSLPLAAAYGTYAAAPLAPAAITGIRKLVKRHKERKKGVTKTSSPRVGSFAQELALILKEATS